jgi:hypothetical protein
MQFIYKLSIDNLSCLDYSEEKIKLVRKKWNTTLF